MIGFYSYTVILTYLSLVFAMVGIHLSVIGVYQWSFICLMISSSDRTISTEPLCYATVSFFFLFCFFRF